MAVGLEQIVAATRVRVAERKRTTDIAALERQAAERQPRGFRAALAARALLAPAIVAELKKALPSKGLIRPQLDVPGVARQLESAGATALSVLTEEEFFLGSLDNLRQASAACALPCLRKDFVVDELQLLEARAAGASAVLLLASVSHDSELYRFLERARQLELDALCEARDEDELRRVLDVGCDLVGVNSRDLRTFRVDLNTPLKLAARIPANVVKVAESGLHSGADIRRLWQAGYQAFLIGESLMAAADPGEALRGLLAQAAASSS